jgi:hypothetical protein
MIVVSKKFDTDNSAIKEHLKNENYDIDDKTGNFEDYYEEIKVIGEVTYIIYILFFIRAHHL